MGFNSPFKVSIRNVRSRRSSDCSLQQLFAALLTQEKVSVCVKIFAENLIWTATYLSLLIHTYIHIYIHIYIYIYSCLYFMYIKIIFYSQSAICYRIDKNCLKCREIPSQSRFVHNISVPPKCTVPKSG